MLVLLLFLSILKSKLFKILDVKEFKMSEERTLGYDLNQGCAEGQFYKGELYMGERMILDEEMGTTGADSIVTQVYEILSLEGSDEGLLKIGIIDRGRRREGEIKLENHLEDIWSPGPIIKPSEVEIF